MRVLVTGAGGFIGGHVVDRLRARGDDVVAAVRPGGAAGRLGPPVTVEKADLTDPRQVDRLFERARPDALLHLAWYARPADYLVSRANLESQSAAIAVAERAIAGECRKIVMAGTCLEYAASERPVSEDHPLDPLTLYASTKAATWLTVRALARAAEREFAWARIFHLFGPGEAAGRMLPSIAGALRRGERVPVTAGEQVRDYLHVRDVAAALVAMLAPGATGAFNVCSGTPVTLRDVVRAIGERVGAANRLDLGARPYAPGEPMHLAGRNDRLRSLGWAPSFASLGDALDDALRAEAG